MHFERALALTAAVGLAATAAQAQSDIFWSAGSGNWGTASNWTPANVPDTTAENARIAGVLDRQIFYNIDGSLNILELGQGTSIFVEPGSTLAMSGDLLNDSFISLNATFSTANSILRFDADATLSGSGILRLSGGGDDAQLTTNGTTITNALGHTIDGAGRVSASLINNGVITALPSGFANRLELSGSPKTNNINMQAAADADLFINGVTINQAPGATISTNAGGTVTFNGNVIINGGRLVGQTGFNRLGNGSLTLTDVVIETSLNVEGGSTIAYSGDTFACSQPLVLNDSDDAGNAILRFDTDSTLTGTINGTGSVFLAGSDNDSQLTTNGTLITITPAFRVWGSGDIPANLINNGTIQAVPSDNGNGQIDLFGSAKVNNNLMVADPGGRLFMNGVTVNQGPAGTLLADGGRIDFNGNCTITNGTLRSVNGGASLRIGNGVLSLTDVLLETALPVEGGGTVTYVGGTFDCDADITLNDSDESTNAVLRFDTDSTLTGGGRVFLAGSGNDSQLQTSGTQIVIASDFTVEGSGDIPATFTNDGLIRAFPSANGNGRIRLFGSVKQNNSLIVADPGGRVLLDGATLTQASDAVLLADGGVIETNGTVNLSGGTLRTINGGTLTRPGNGVLALTDILLETAIPVEGGATVTYVGDTFDCDSTITLNDSADQTNAVLRFDTDSTLTGGGLLFLAGSGNDSQLQTNGTQIVIASDFTVEGSGDIPATFTNDGLIRAFPSSNGNGRIRLFGSVKQNNSLIVAEPGGRVRLDGATLTQASDAVLLADGGVIETNGNVNLTGGTLRAISGGAVTRPGNGALSLSDLVLEAEIPAEGGAFVIYQSDEFENNGSILLNTDGSVSDAILRFDANTLVTGAGTIEMRRAGNDSRIETNGTAATFGPGQTVRGIGRMTGSFTFEGRLEPGLPVGSITATSANLSFAPSSVYAVEASDASTADLVDCGTRPVSLAGTLTIEGIDGYIPMIDDEWVVLTAGQIDGTFDSVQIVNNNIPAGIRAVADYGPNTVTVRITCSADLNGDGILDLSDINLFVQGFITQDPAADLAPPFGVWDLSDINTFVSSFLGTCI